jgi:hypothetical protein
LASGGALLVTDAATRRTIGSSRFFGYSVMMRHAFRFVSSVVLFVSAGNVRSQRAVSKIGGLLEDKPDAVGRLVYRVTASSFEERVRLTSR